MWNILFHPIIFHIEKWVDLVFRSDLLIKLQRKEGKIKEIADLKKCEAVQKAMNCWRTLSNTGSDRIYVSLFWRWQRGRPLWIYQKCVLGLAIENYHIQSQIHRESSKSWHYLLPNYNFDPIWNCLTHLYSAPKRTCSLKNLFKPIWKCFTKLD